MNWRAVFFSFRLGAVALVRQPLLVVGRVGIFVAVIVSVAPLLAMIPDATMHRLGISHGELIWYAILARLMMVGIGRQVNDVQYEVRQGYMDTALLRPASFWQLQGAGWLGAHVVQLAATAPFALAVGFVFTGSLPLGLSRALWLPSLFLGAVLILLGHLLAAYSAMWIRETRQIGYIFYKFIMILGAMLWPFAFYPGWMESLAMFTPFPAMIAYPASFVLPASGRMLAGLALQQLIWLVVLLALCGLMGRAIERKVRQ